MGTYGGYIPPWGGGREGSLNIWGLVEDFLNCEKRGTIAVEWGEARHLFVTDKCDNRKNGGGKKKNERVSSRHVVT